MMNASKQLTSRIAFSVTAATALGSSGWLFRDLADVSQWILKCDRNDVFETFRLRHKIAAVSVASVTANTLITFRTRCMPVYTWAAVNGVTAFMFYSGYINPELMMRPRNRNAVYVPASDILNHLKREETVIVTQVGGDEPRAFPDSQVLRPHVARVGTTDAGSQVTMTYCGLTNLGICYEIPPHEDGTEVELIPLTQLENNLVLMDKATGHIGQHINGVDETSLLQKIGGTSYEETKRRLPEALLRNAQLQKSEMGKELPTWRMTLGNFVRTYPQGDVFINDYKVFKDLKKPIKTIYDTIMDFIFEFSVYFQHTNPAPVFPTLKNIDPRLPPKEHVWGLNVGDDYVALTESFVRDGPNGIRNFMLDGKNIVASWDANASSLGIWYVPDGKKKIIKPVNVHGKLVGDKKGGKSLERVPTVKNGCFLCVWSTFFPQTRVNPES